MKKIFLLFSAVLLFSLIPSAFSLPENLFNGSSLFDKLPLIEAGKTTEFRIKLFYKSGPYALEELTPIIDIYPQSLTRYLTINTESVSGSLNPVSTVIIKGNITASPDIPAGKTSLVYYFSAKDARGNSYKSSWSDSSPPIDIKNKEAMTYTPTGIIYNDSPLQQFKAGIKLDDILCKENHVLVVRFDHTPACVKLVNKEKLIQRKWAVEQELSINNTGVGLNDKKPISNQTLASKSELELPPLQIKVSGDKQVRRGTTQTIEIQVVRGNALIENAKVYLDIEDYSKHEDYRDNFIKEFEGYTDSHGYFVFSWEVPQSFDDVKYLLAFIDVTDGISSTTERFEFQVYCLPGEKNCKAEGN